jgi:hypothetical protein
MRRTTVDRMGTVAVVAIAVIVLLVVGVSGAFKVGSDDMYLLIDEAHGTHLSTPRSTVGRWLSERFTSDLAPTNLAAIRTRADQLHYRSERIQEVATVVALGGLLVAVVSGSPGTDTTRGREASSPTANTASNGTA